MKNSPFYIFHIQIMQDSTVHRQIRTEPPKPNKTVLEHHGVALCKTFIINLFSSYLRCQVLELAAT